MRTFAAAIAALLVIGCATPGGHRPGVYLTEFGYFTRGPRAVSEQRAAAWWPRAIEQARRVGARQLVVYGLTEGATWRKWDTSVLTPVGRLGPAATAIAEAVGR